MRAFAARICLFLLGAMLAGCSALRFGYSNGESVVYWWLNDYVDFEADQRPLVRKHIDNLFTWHRKTQLKDYARLLVHGRQRLQLPHDVTQADVAAEYDAVRERMLAIIDKALPELADLALSLRPQQIAHIEKKFASNNDTYRKEYLRGGLEDRQRYRYKQVMKQAEYWFGEFSTEQEIRIRAASDARPLDNELRMAQRLRRQQELVALLKRIRMEKSNRETAMRMLKDYVDASLSHFGDERHNKFADASKEGTIRMIATMINLATPAQKAHAMRQLQQWIEDCHVLTRERS